MGLTIGTVTLTTTDLAIILGAGVFAISKGYKIKIGKGDYYIEMEPK